MRRGSPSPWSLQARSRSAVTERCWKSLQPAGAAGPPRKLERACAQRVWSELEELAMLVPEVEARANACSAAAERRGPTAAPRPRDSTGSEAPLPRLSTTSWPRLNGRADFGAPRTLMATSCSARGVVRMPSCPAPSLWSPSAGRSAPLTLSPERSRLNSLPALSEPPGPETAPLPLLIDFARARRFW